MVFLLKQPQVAGVVELGVRGVLKIIPSMRSRQINCLAIAMGEVARVPGMDSERASSRAALRYLFGHVGVQIPSVHWLIPADYDHCDRQGNPKERDDHNKDQSRFILLG